MQKRKDLGCWKGLWSGRVGSHSGRTGAVEKGFSADISPCIFHEMHPLLAPRLLGLRASRVSPLADLPEWGLGVRGSQVRLLSSDLRAALCLWLRLAPGQRSGGASGWIPGPWGVCTVISRLRQKANLPWKLLRQSHPGALRRMDAVQSHDLLRADPMGRALRHLGATGDPWACSRLSCHPLQPLLAAGLGSRAGGSEERLPCTLGPTMSIPGLPMLLPVPVPDGAALLL